MSEIYLSKEQLFSYTDWNAKSKEYINSLPEKAPLLDIAKVYFEKVNNFYLWYENRNFEIFKCEFEELIN